MMKMQFLMVSCTLLFTAGVMADTCPGGRVRCPDFMTCCQLHGGDFGCCPYPDAKCCIDQVHCCPYNMDCDATHQSCVKKGSGIKLPWLAPVSPDIVEVLPEEESIQKEMELEVGQENIELNDCPDKTSCDSKFTCCKMYSGKFGCCPYDNATCCQDGFHCCPNGSKCLASGSCVSAAKNYTIDAYYLKDKKKGKNLKLEQSLSNPLPLEVSDPGGLCPDGHPCPEKYTCCKIEGKRYGCCPYQDARCCDDGIHCCPKGTNCNTTLGTCDMQRNVGGSLQSPPLRWSTVSTRNIIINHIDKVVPSDVVCPDERYHCPSGSTCCQLIGGSYGCCPMDRATCCSDKEHCCPFGYECVSDGCRKGTTYLTWTEATTKTPSEREEEKAKANAIQFVTSDVVCPDDYPCPDGNTCCQLPDEGYGCCPMEKATCCADQVHCCPHGYRCVTDGCRKSYTSSGSHPLLSIAATKPKAVDEKKNVQENYGVVCPDKASECPDEATCCQLASGKYGCCPYENATCCGDQEHCCPHGYWCLEDGCDRITGFPQDLLQLPQKHLVGR